MPPRGARVAQTTVCDTRTCRSGILLVRGMSVSFVSVEQVREVGRHKLDAENMPADIVIRPEFVLVHDTTGKLLDRCNLYLVRWRTTGASVAPVNYTEAVADARAYFGRSSRVAIGTVDIPKGPWHRVAKVQFIRYWRAGHASKHFEHEFTPSVSLEYQSHPLAWRLNLPAGCIVGMDGFERP